ncbi:MAG: maleate cis-trans isomerase family protein [Ornithinimicrobium sp.]|uniref:maleate cis-trans isomerase family protein n=1 Tax=Ornithinimicrobium sp. TaxID=1977084 RepID=UPI00180D52D0|nr:aspartate/glutamate racemase family protein [Actinomycetota bacterium]
MEQHVGTGARDCAQGGPTAAALGVGVIAPYDFALDRELWRWVPDSVNLLLTRTPHHDLPVSVDQAEAVSGGPMLTACARSLSVTCPDVVAYACTSGSFVHGLDGEARLRQTIESAGVPRAVTTSGALLQALAGLGVRRLAVATPYDAAVTTRLCTFLAAAGVEVVSCSHLGLTEHVWRLPPAEVTALVGRCAHADADAVFISCTNVPTYDLLAPMEAEHGIPVLSANQVTLWSALAAVGLRLVGDGQSLVDVAGPTRACRDVGASG